MKLLILILVISSIGIIESVPTAKEAKEAKLRDDFANFKKQHPKKSDLDDEKRFNNFKKNSDLVESLNQRGQGKVKFSINDFADLDTQTDLKKLTGAKAPVALSSTILSMGLAKVTSLIDWRTSNIVTPVRNQGYCGSCWAFAALASLESALIRYKKRTLNLSEQNLVDCDLKNFGCDGGYIDAAFNYIKNGVMNETLYPYTGIKGTCKFSPTRSAEKITSSVYFNYESALETALVTFGPIVTLVEVTDEFYFYSSGVMTGSLCTSGINHAVTVVGFNNTANPPFWIVKNSWGTSWGEKGYFRIRKGSSTCGIGLYNYRPVL